MQLKQVCDFCRWPPVGTRGVGFSRANLFGENFDDYREEAQQPFIVAMIEHVSAVKSLDKILSVRGLDAIFIGPYDLSASMGITGQFNDIKFTDTIAKICELSKKNKIPCGIHIVNPSIEELRTRVVEGYRFLAYSIDSVILSKELKKASNFMKNSL
jgi:2-dehydro-3-deoxyglucarate aldolase